MRVECVCFDLDDTLYDYQQYARAGLDAAADRIETVTGERYHDELHRLYFQEDLTQGTFDRLVADQDLPQAMVEDLVDAFHNASGSLSPYPETRTVLGSLEEYPLGLITDGRGGYAKLNRLGIRNYFDSVMVTPSVSRSKRDPVVFKAVLTDLGVPPEAAVYVGDDPRIDFRVPNQLGMSTVRLRRGRHVDREPSDPVASADVEINHLDRLLSVLELLGADNPSNVDRT